MISAVASRPCLRLLLAMVLGALAGFGQAPYDLPIVMVAAVCAMLALCFRFSETVKQAALCGLAFGTGYFAHVMHWITSPFMVDAARHAWMAPFALALMALGAGLFWAVAFGVARWLSPGRAWPLVLCWTAIELIRAYIFTGLPWGMFSQALVDVMAGQGLAWVGPHGMVAAVVALAVAVVAPGRTAMQQLLRVALALGGGALLLIPPIAPEPTLTDKVVRLVQPNAPQHQKWDRDMVHIFFERQIKATAASPRPDLIVWPETAIPWLLHYADEPLALISDAAGDVPVLLGLQRQEDARYYNSLVVLGSDGAIKQLYDKHHLVPFGEYVPLGDLMAGFGIKSFASQVGYGYTAGPGARVLELGTLGRVLPMICYETVFAHDVNAAPQRPDWLVQITNDAWFGQGAGPQQHLAQARMRAIEQGLPLARSANTGISAMIGPRGSVLRSLGLGQGGHIDAPLPAPLPPTLYSRTGDLPLALVLLVGLCAAVFARRSQS